MQKLQFNFSRTIPDKEFSKQLYENIIDKENSFLKKENLKNGIKIKV